MKKGFGALILAFSLISLGGLLLHLRIHAPWGEEAQEEILERVLYTIVAVVGVVNVAVLPFMYRSRKTASLAFLITVLTVVFGTVGMAYHSVEHLEAPLSIQAILLESTLADIAILLSKLGIGYVLLRMGRQG